MDKKTKFTNIDEYIKLFPEDIQAKLKQLRELIKELAPEAVEAISYQMPTFKLNGKNLVHFAAFKNHIGFYPLPSGVEAFKEETKDFVTSTGAIQFPHNQPLPISIIKKIVLFRIQENKEKTSSYKK